MAIEDSNKPNANNFGGQQQQQQQQRFAEPEAPRGKNWSFHGSTLFGAPIGRGMGSEYLTKLVTALGEVYKQTNADVEVTLLPVDRTNETILAFSMIIVALRFKADPAAGVAYHMLLIEATGDKIQPLEEVINGQKVEIMRLPCDGIDEVLRAKAHERVRNAFQQGPFFPVDGCVVPKTFNPEDKYQVHRLALNAGLATGTELEVHRPTFEDFNLATAQQDSNLVINIGFSNQQLEDAVGEPMRSDVLINFTSQKQQQGNQRNNSIHSGDRQAGIAEASAFLDVVWAPVHQGPALNQWVVPNQQIQTQKYAARAVITNLISDFAYTPASILLSLVTALSLRDDNNWVQAFRPQPVSGNEIDYRDIGALNIEGNLPTNQPDYNPAGFGTRIDTKADSFRLEDLGQLVAALIQPGLMLSMDCPEASPQTWYLSIFAAAANGSKAAYDMLYNAAQELTNSAFGVRFPKGSQMFTDINNRVHLGHWTDTRGNRRDIRDIDTLAVANLVGDRNPKLLRDWSDTWTQTQFPLAMRLAARKKIIQGLTNETAEFTGWAQRVTFTGAFMDALAMGCKDAGLAVRVNTPLSSSDFNNQRGVATFVSNALMQPSQTFMSSGNFGYSQGPSYGHMGAGSRWG